MESRSRWTFPSDGALFRRHVLLLALILWSLANLAAYAPPPRWILSDGSALTFTKESVSRAKDGRILWTLPALQPCMPLVFEDSRGGANLLLYEMVEEEGGIPSHGRFRAVDIPRGRTAWESNFWGTNLGPGESQAPRQPVVYQEALWYGRGCWLDSLDRDTGTVRARYWTVESVEKLQAAPDGTLRISLGLPSRSHNPALVIRFDGTHLWNPLNSPSNLITQILLMRQGVSCVSDFFGSGKPESYGGFLDLYRFKRAPMPPDFAQKFEDFDLGKPESLLLAEFSRDPLNPYLPMMLAFLRHFQGRQAEAESFFQEAIGLSGLSWHEPLWMGSECEKLGFTRWADALYERGERAYFERVPSPGTFATLIEVLIHYPAQRQGAALFYNGHVERALDLIRLRRQVFPFTEGDWMYHTRTFAWLQEKGDERRVAEEGSWGRWAEGEGVSKILSFPWWFQGWFGVYLISWALLLILIGRAFLKRGDAIPALLIVIVGLSLDLGFRAGEMPEGVSARFTNSPGFGRWVPLVALAAATLFLPFIAWVFVRWEMRKRRSAGGEMKEEYPPIMALLSQSTPLYVAVLLTVPPWGTLLTGNPWAGTILGTLCLTSLAWYRRWGRGILLGRGFPVRVMDRKVLACAAGTYLLTWLLSAFILYQISILGSIFSMPYPWADLSHPLWRQRLAELDAHMTLRSADFRFARALTLHLGGEVAEATRRYAELPEDARALNNLGVLALKENPGRAEALFQDALRVDPVLPAALYNLGVLQKDPALLAKARAGDPWRVRIQQKYKQGQLMIAAIPVERVAASTARNRELVRAFAGPLAATRAAFGATKDFGFKSQ